MSEIPELQEFKLNPQYWKTSNKELLEEYIELNYISLTSLKEVNTFWDKYKDNDMQFVKDYPNYELDAWEIKMNARGKNITFKDWLHDLLFKVV